MTITDQRPTPDVEAQEHRSALFRLVLVLIAGALAAYALGIAKATLVVLAVVVMIMLHELGHFTAAKLSGMKVTEYFVGFGPRLWSLRKGETEYGVKALPLGGYVKIIGMHNLEDVEPADEPRTYRQQSFPKRLAVAIAGSFMHFVIAFILLLVLHTTTGIIRYDKQPLSEIGEISRLTTGPSPAQKAGLQVGDRINAIDGERVRGWGSMRNYIQDHPGQPIEFAIEREGQPLTVTVTPVSQEGRRVGPDGKPVGKPQPVGFVGISPAYPVEKEGFVRGIGRSAGDIGLYSKETVKALGSMFSFDGMQKYGDQLTSGRGPTTPSEDQPRFLSPVGLARVASQAAENGMRQVLVLLISINIFVGILNMFPMLPFDGGHVAIAVYEAIRSKLAHRRYHADVAKLLPVTYAVFLLLMFLAVTSLYLDIARPLNLQ